MYKLIETGIVFKDFETWVNKAPSWLGTREDKDELVCIDTKCMVCKSGEQFHKAKKRKSFPITVYKVIEDKEVI